MKNLLTIALLLMVSIVTANIKLEGYFLNASKVSYEIYEDTGEDMILIKDKKTTFSYFREKLDINKNYLLVFRKEDRIKFLYLEARKSITISIDIDFKTTDNAQITYNKNRYEYRILGENKSCFTYNI